MAPATIQAIIVLYGALNFMRQVKDVRIYAHSAVDSTANVPVLGMRGCLNMRDDNIPSQKYRDTAAVFCDFVVCRQLLKK